MVYRFGCFKLDTASFELTQDRKPVAIEPQVFDLITYLIDNRDRLVTRQELFERVWHGKEVCDTSLSNHVKSARKALGDSGQSQNVIKTVHGRGYQFIAPIENEPSLGQSPLKLLWRTHPIKISTSLMVLILVLVFLGRNYQPSHTRESITSTPTYLIAVLPFANTKPDHKTDYFGFAIADRIIGDLTYLQGITVRPSSAIRKYASMTSFEPTQIGNELNVDYVLTGNYLNVANNIRLNAELVEVNSGNLVWRANQIEADYQNAFELQDIVAQQIMQGLKIELSQSAMERIRRDVPENALAYEYYLRSIAQPFTTDGNKLAIELLKKSINLDDQYAPAYVQLGNRIRRLEQFGLINSGESENTIDYYRKALSLNDELLSALSYLAFLYTETNRIDDAMQVTQKMLSINPDNAATHFTLGYIFRYAGVNDRAIEAMERAISVDPNNPKYRSIIATYSGLNEFEKALMQVKHYKRSPFTIGWNGILNFKAGRHDQAREYFQQLTQEDPEGLWGLVAQVHLAYLDGNVTPGLYATHKLEQTNITDAETVYHSAAYYGLLNDKQRCLQRLKKAVDGGYFNYEFIQSSIYFDSVRHEPQYQDILHTAKERHAEFVNKHLNSNERG